MNRSLIFACGIVVISAKASYAQDVSACATDANVPAALAQELDQLLSNTIDVDGPLTETLGAAPGAVLSVQGPDWHYARAAGAADPDTGAPISCEMPFQIGSNTKMMVATLLLQLHEEGALSLEDPLSVHLPDMAAAIPNGADITLRQLANHTAGVFSYTDNAPDGAPGIMEGDITDPVALRRGYTMQELVAFAIEHGEPTFAPGDEGAWAYSNTGYILLGLIIEAIEERPLGESLQARIFDPLQMGETFYGTDVPAPELGLPRAFLGVPFDLEMTDWNLSQGAAAGAVISTASDMHIFIEALLTGELFSEPSTLALMQQTVTTSNPLIAAYGIGVMEKLPGVWGHGGQTLGYESDVAMFVDSGISVVGWGTSSSNPMAVGTFLVSEALNTSGALADPTAPDIAVQRDQIVGPEWRLTSTTTAEGATQDVTAGSYTITFENSGDFFALADCNRVLGAWALDASELEIDVGPVTRAACPPESLSDSFIGWLSATSAAELSAANSLRLIVDDAQGPRVLHFEAR